MRIVAFITVWCRGAQLPENRPDRPLRNGATHLRMPRYHRRYPAACGL